MQWFKKELAAFDFKEPIGLQEVMDWINARMEHGIVHLTHPRYFGLFNPSPTFPAQCADRIVGAFNPQLASSKTSPVPVEIEAHVIRMLAERIGLPKDAGGHFTSGGSEANFTALLCALTRANDNFGAKGARAFKGAPVLYVSCECNLSWVKIGHEAGIGRGAVRLIETDGKGCLDTAALESKIKSDVAEGHVPVMIVATAGTTGAGMIDPLEECAAIARRCDLWYHVDAAWGGAVIVSDRWRGLLRGLELADSLTIDAHKWLATTMAAGMFFTRHADLLATAFGVSTSFMPSYVQSADPYLTSMQWSRRCMGLRLFLSLAAAGWHGYAAHVEHSIALARYARERFEAIDWTIANNSSLAVLCLEPPAAARVAAEDIVRRVLASGQAWVSVATFEGRKVIRVCVTNGETSRGDIDTLVNALDTALRV
jgi:glutamate/tyrosine decarboxylase-like PLP-dependent enzyme